MEPKHAELDEIGCKISNIKLGDKEARLKGGEVKPLKDDDVRVAEAKLDLEVEREWKQLQNDSATGKIEMSTNPRSRKICKGLAMYAPHNLRGCGRGLFLTLCVDPSPRSSNHMNMRCGDTGRLMWQSDEWYGSGSSSFRLFISIDSVHHRGEHVFRVEQEGETAYQFECASVSY
jgi:hypothetical protein